MERRAPFVADEAKFFTQKALTFVLLAIFTGAAGWVLWIGTEAERSTIIQTIILLTTAAVMYWIGSSKGSADKSETLGKLSPTTTTTTTPQQTITTTAPDPVNLVKPGES